MRGALEPILYYADRGELSNWNGRYFPGTRVMQCSVTFNPVTDYRTGAMRGVDESLKQISGEVGAIEGVCLHHWLFDDESKAVWVRTLLRGLRGRRILRMQDLVEGRW